MSTSDPTSNPATNPTSNPATNPTSDRTSNPATDPTSAGALRRRRHDHTSSSTRVVMDPDAGGLVVVKRRVGRDAVASVEREAEVLDRLHHPGVVELVRADIVDPDTATLVTHFAGRTTLADLRPTDPAHVARIGSALLTIVAELHRMGWTHGRLTADHVLVGANGRLTLCSLGDAARCPDDDIRHTADAVDALSTIRELVDRLPPPGDRVTRRSRRTLDSIMGRVAAAPTRSNVIDLRDALARLGGTTAPTTPVIEDDTTRPPSEDASLGSDDTAGPTLRTSSGGRSWKNAGAALGMLAAMFGAVAFIRWVGGPIGDPLTERSMQRIGDVPEPIRLAFSVVRIVAFAACLYGIALSAATLAAILTQRPDVQHLATSMAPPRLRRTLVALIGIGMLTSVATGPDSSANRSGASAPAATPRSGAPTTVLATTTTPTTTTPTTTPNAPVDALDPGRSDSLAPVVPITSAASRRPEPVPASALPNLWVIQPGDHLWRVAEATMSRHLGRPATDDEVDGYWRAVVDLNRPSLLDPSDPDLVVAGQVIELPPIE